MKKQDKVQGEGNYEAAEQYDQAQRKFVKSGQVQQAARDAAPKSPAEADEMEQAEQAGRSRAKEEDPNVKRPRSGK